MSVGDGSSDGQPAHLVIEGLQCEERQDRARRTSDPSSNGRPAKRKSLVRWRSIKRQAGHLVTQLVSSTNVIHSASSSLAPGVSARYSASSAGPTDQQPLGNQELWKFVHSVYGGDLGFSSNEESSGHQPSSSQPGEDRSSVINQELPACPLPSSGSQASAATISGVGGGSNSHSPSPSLHSAQTSNDDELYFHHLHQFQHRGPVSAYHCYLCDIHLMTSSVIEITK